MKRLYPLLFIFLAAPFFVSGQATCGTAVSIACGGSAAGTTVGSAPPAGIPACSGATGTGGSVWYTITGTGQDITASLCGATSTTDYDSYLSVFTGSCGAGTLTCVDESDDANFPPFPAPPNPLCSELTFSSTVGIQYWILISGFGADEGNYTLTISCAAATFPGDECNNAIPIACPSTVTGDNSSPATTSDYPTCGTASFTNSGAIWYEFTGNDQLVTASLCNATTTFDSYLLVYSGDYCGDLNCLDGNDDNAGCASNALSSEVSFIAFSGTTYYIVVSGFFGQFGPYELNMTCSTVVINDECSGAQEINCGDVVNGTTVGSASDGPPLPCGDPFGSPAVDGLGSGGVWYHWTGNGDIVTASLCGSAYNTQIAVYSGSCGLGLNCETGNDQYCADQSRVTFNSVNATDYYILVYGASGEVGDFTLTLDCLTPTGGDVCASATEVFCGNSYAGSTAGMTSESRPDCGGVSDGSGGALWYRFEGTGQVVTASLCGSEFDTQVRVFEGTTCASLSCVDGNDDFGGCQNTTDSQVSFVTNPGTDYFILVHGFGGSQGVFSLEITCGANPFTAGDCSGAQATCQDNLINPLAQNSGNFADLNSGNDGCLAGEHKTKWFVFKTLPITHPNMQPSGNCFIEFTILTGGADYDWAMWGPYTGASAACQGLADGDDPLKCSWAAGTGDTGAVNVGPESSEGAGGDRFVNGYNADGDDYFILVVDNWSQNDVTFGLDFAATTVSCLDCDILLPIELLSFSGFAMQGKNVLEWTTAIEINNDYFTIERSHNGLDFHSIGTIGGAGNSSQALNYSMVDDDPLPGTNYYRLKQTDFDGAFETFHPIAIDSDNAIRDFKLFPNPGTDVVTVISSGQDIERETILTIHDTRGFVVEQLTLNSQRMTFDVSHLATGMYLIQMTNDRISETLTFIKQ